MAHLGLALLGLAALTLVAAPGAAILLHEAALGPACEPVAREAIPDCIRRRAEAHVRFHLGAAMRHVALDAEHTRFVPVPESCIAEPAGCTDNARTPQYMVVHRLRMPPYDFVNQTMAVFLGLDGGLLRTESIPHCRADPGECRFIGPGRAEAKAKSLGLPQGIEPWRTELVFHARAETYAWKLSSTLRQSELGDEAHGVDLAIDANSGALLGWAHCGRHSFPAVRPAPPPP